MKALSVILIVALATSQAHADDASSDRREANALYKEGVRLFEAGEFATALDMFQAAYKRWPDSRIEYSIATTLRKIGRLVDAANAYQTFLVDPRAEPKLVTDAKTAQDALHATLGLVEITFEGPTGEIRIDGGPWIAATTIFVEAGSFTINARRDGFIADASSRVSAGATEHVELHWKALEQPRPLPVAKPDPVEHARSPVPPPAPPHRSHRRILAVSVAGGGVALAGGALGFELASRGKIADARTLCPDLHCAEPAHGRAQALLDAASARRTAALVFGGAAVVAIATGTALWLTDRSAGVHVLPSSDGDSVELVIAGRF